jgi:hypothetical protein
VFLLKHNGRIDLLVQGTKDTYKRVFKYGELPIPTRYIIETLAKGRLKLLRNQSPLLLLENLMPELDLSMEATAIAERQERCQRMIATETDLAGSVAFRNECKSILDFGDVQKRLVAEDDEIVQYAENAKGEIVGAVTKDGYYLPISVLVRPINLPKRRSVPLTQILEKGRLRRDFEATQDYLKRIVPELYAPAVYVFGKDNATAVLNAKGLVCLFKETEGKSISPGPGMNLDIMSLNVRLYEKPKEATTMLRKTYDEVRALVGQFGLGETVEVVAAGKVEALAVKYSGEMIVIPVRPVATSGGPSVKAESFKVRDALKYIKVASQMKRETEFQLPCQVIRGYMNDEKEYDGLIIEGDYRISLAAPQDLRNQELVTAILDSFITFDVLEPTMVAQPKMGDLLGRQQFFAVKDFVFKEMAGMLQRHELRHFKNTLVRYLSQYHSGKGQAFRSLRSRLLMLLQALAGLVVEEGDGERLREDFDDLDYPLSKCRGWVIMKNPVCICRLGKVHAQLSQETFQESKELIAELNEDMRQYRENNRCALMIPRHIGLTDIIKSIRGDLLMNQFRRYQLQNNVFKQANLSSLYQTDNPQEEILTESAADPRYRSIEDIYRKVHRKFYRGFLPYGEAEPDFGERSRIVAPRAKSITVRRVTKKTI